MYKYTAQYTNRYRRNRRLMIKQGRDMAKLDKTIDLLLTGEPMPPNYQDHPLKGDFYGKRECHVGGEGDWLLVYRRYEDTLILLFIETGTHQDIFGG